ncbi:MAG: ISL3 family transposase [Clostridiales bacterium]|nr:ISL3 family transposase [Candidatus Cacconaster stercorequi]
MGIAGMQDINKILAFGNVMVTSFDQDEKTGEITLFGELKGNLCSVCGSDNVSKRSRYVRTLADCPIMGHKVTLKILTSRLDCHNMKVPHANRENVLPLIQGVASGARITPRLKAQIANYDFSKETFSNIARKFGVSLDTVCKIFDEKITALESELKYPECTMIGIDEVHLGELGKNSRPRMCGTIVDLSNSDTKLIDVLRHNNKATVLEAFRKFPSPEKIKWVCMDMHTPYVSAVKEFLPKAKIIIDRFHVEATLTAAVGLALKQVNEFYEREIQSLSEQADREEQMRKFKKRPYSAFWFKKKVSTYNEAYDILQTKQKDGRKATSDDLKKAKSTYGQFKKLMTLCNAYPEYQKVFMVRNAFAEMYDKQTRSEAEDSFMKAVSLLPPRSKKEDILAPFWKYVDTFGRWNDMILNYFDAANEPHRSNGPVEGWNKHVSGAFNFGNGYKFEHFRAKVLFGAGNVVLSDDFKLVSASSNHALAAASVYAGNDDNCSKTTTEYFRSLVRGIAKTPEMKKNAFVADVARNVSTANYSTLREVVLTNPQLSFNVARELDSHISTEGHIQFLGISLEDFIAASNFIHAQISAHLEDESVLVNTGNIAGDTLEEEYDDFDLDMEF